jgi:hypothetical protein
MDEEQMRLERKDELETCETDRFLDSYSQGSQLTEQLPTFVALQISGSKKAYIKKFSGFCGG